MPHMKVWGSFVIWYVYDKFFGIDEKQGRAPTRIVLTCTSLTRTLSKILSNLLEIDYTVRPYRS